MPPFHNDTSSYLIYDNDYCVEERAAPFENHENHDVDDDTPQHHHETTDADAASQQVRGVVPMLPSECLNRKNVSFGSVRVRDYNRTVGDHPDCPLGPPLTLDWDYEEFDPVSVEDYELNGCCEKNDSSSSSNQVCHRRRQRRRRRRAAPDDLNPMSSIIRKNLLHYEFGIPMEELFAAEAAVQKSARERHETLRRCRSFLRNKTDELVESAKREARKILQVTTDKSWPRKMGDNTDGKEREPRRKTATATDSLKVLFEISSSKPLD